VLPVALPETLFSTTQFITVFWATDKATRIILNRMKRKNYEFSIWGLRIHHWLVGIIVAALGLMMLSAQNLVMLLYETGLIGIPWKLSSSTITVGFRLFIDDLKDLKKQLKNITLRIKR
jgi:UDP-N-acetylmuramyl pentapeptide phosphotransferase/UDP-N-acetylglucosamine-1-phosphate transferase